MEFTVHIIHDNLCLLSSDSENFINIPIKDLPEDVKVNDVLTIENGMFCHINSSSEDI